MTIEVRDVILFIFGVFISAGLAVIGWLLVDMKSRLQKDIDKNACDIKETQKELGNFKSSLPYSYVLRDDFIRAITNIDRKIDQVAAEVSSIGKNVSKLVGGEKT